MKNLLFDEVFVFLKGRKLVFLIGFLILSLPETVFELDKGSERGVFVSVQIQDNFDKSGDVAYMGKGLPLEKPYT